MIGIFTLTLFNEVSFYKTNLLSGFGGSSALDVLKTEDPGEAIYSSLESRTEIKMAEFTADLGLDKIVLPDPFLKMGKVPGSDVMDSLGDFDIPGKDFLDGASDKISSTVSDLKSSVGSKVSGDSANSIKASSAGVGSKLSSISSKVTNMFSSDSGSDEDFGSEVLVSDSSKNVDEEKDVKADIISGPVKASVAISLAGGQKERKEKLENPDYSAKEGETFLDVATRRNEEILELNEEIDLVDIQNELKAFAVAYEKSTNSEKNYYKIIISDFEEMMPYVDNLKDGTFYIDKAIY